MATISMDTTSFLEIRKRHPKKNGQIFCNFMMLFSQTSCYKPVIKKILSMHDLPHDFLL